jgi:tyrosine phenol-lyase
MTDERPARRHSWAEPYKIKMVEPLRMTTRTEREGALTEAGWNTFLLRSRDVYIDLLTDSGTNAMSQEQWAALMLGDEAYAGSESFYRFERAVQDVYGYPFMVPTHQGRGAEHIISKVLINGGDVVPGNMYFTTTRLHQELAGGTFVDIIIDEAHDPSSEHPFKGDVDLAKLRRVIAEYGRERIPYVSIAVTVNMAGGQPMSLANIADVHDLCRAHGIPLYCDITRIAENAWFIRQREPGFADVPVAEIVRRICDLTDGAWMSAKKDALVNIGGFLALRDPEVFEEARNLCVVYEGLHTYGGLAGRDMEAIAQGLHESVDQAHLDARIGQVLYLGEQLRREGVPIVLPIGGHAVFLDAAGFLPHLPQDQFPGQRLAGEIYLEAGVRTMERGIVSAGRDPGTGDHRHPRLELVRITIPRRVYTQAHMDVTAEAVLSVWDRRDSVRGLAMTFEPKYLRFFQARFQPL